MWNENPSLVSRKSLICICAQQSAYGEGHPEEGGTGAYIYISYSRRIQPFLIRILLYNCPGYVVQIIRIMLFK